MERRVVLLAILGVHLVAAVGHGSTHALVPVVLTPWQNLVVLVTTFLGPVAGVVLAWRDSPLGVPLFAMTMAGSLVVGGYLHFLVENPDHVRVIPAGPWRIPFQVSAAGVALTAGLGTAVGAWYWYTQERQTLQPSS